MSRLCVLLMLAIAGFAQPARVAACAGYACRNEQFLPRSGVVPANTRAIAWSPGRREDDVSDELIDTEPEELRVECESKDGARRSLEFVGARGAGGDDYDRIELSEPLVAGDHCTISGGVSNCKPEYADVPPGPHGISYIDGRAEFDVGEASPEPEELGKLVLSRPERTKIDLSSASGSCSEPSDACTIHATVQLSAAAMPWKDVLMYEARVDGQRWWVNHNIIRPSELGGLSEGRDHELLFGVSEEVPESGVRNTSGLEPGEHTIVVEAHLPGSDRTLSTGELTAKLECKSTGESSHDSSCSISHVGHAQRSTRPWFCSMLCAALALVRRRRALARTSVLDGL